MSTTPVAPTLHLKFRFRGRVELPNWQDGPDLFTALEQAEAKGWHAYDREPGAAPGEYAIFHMQHTLLSSESVR